MRPPMLRRRPAVALAAAVALLTGCPPAEDPCADAAEELGFAPCVLRVPDVATWKAVSIETAAIDQRRVGKHMIPAHDDARLPTLYVDANEFDLHFDFMVRVFGERFPALTPVEYVEMVLDPDAREFYTGVVIEYVAPDGSPSYGWTIWDDLTDPDRALTVAELEAAWEGIRGTWDVEPFAWAPSSERQRRDALFWETDVPMTQLQSNVAYEAYTQATGYGTVRLLPVAELADAIASASIGFQDLLVLDDAPLDVERVVSGAVTAGRQNELSHLNVRSAARGTPNCYLRDAFTELAEWEGELVALTCGADGLTIEPATVDEAEAWWAALRPDPVDVPEPDVSFDGLTPLLDIPTSAAAARAASLARYGAKASALGAVYQRIDDDLQLDGFAVPFAYYDAFMASHGFAATLDEWLADEEFAADAALRRTRLEQLRAGIEAADVDPTLIDALAAQIEATWGTDDRMVRFRSSSNAEDSLRFSGAGLYDSTSACLADELDGDDTGPSRCDPDQPDERTLTRALRRVWASLWTMQAYEERAWFGIDHAQVAMGVLVNDRSKDERANVVVFTGDPTGPGDDRYVVNAQAGEASVVSPEPAQVTEKVLLTIEDGAVVDIERVRESNLVPPGGVVLDDDRLRELGAAMAVVADVFPVDEEPPAGGVVLVDSEWKVLSDGRLIVKQARPFLRMEE